MCTETGGAYLEHIVRVLQREVWHGDLVEESLLCPRAGALLHRCAQQAEEGACHTSTSPPSPVHGISPVVVVTDLLEHLWSRPEEDKEVMEYREYREYRVYMKYRDYMEYSEFKE